MIGTAMKYWGLTWRQAMWEISWLNLAMLNASVPRYDRNGNRQGPTARLTGRDLAARLKKS